MSTTKKPKSDLRERKRQVTLDQIAQTGLRLFMENGYEATTLDAIAEASGISRRTFFYYLKSKEDVLLAHESGNIPRLLRPTFLKQSPKQSPLSAARETFLSLASMYETKESVMADRILRSIETLRLRKEALHVQLEQVLAEAMYELWPDPAKRPVLRLSAMIAMSTLRFAKDNWRLADEVQPLTHFIDEAFASLDEVIMP
ncbi:TetR/AcrR family transcriptional regulator [Dyella acidiphila]|uniref:TetR family transcriptional regulator n=1 Tax=Dyella acidiphila TaxID=2775866 RepID=A0ABR9GA51_9GAMM|nr:TetR/AcrR family transcriptional regulator [Dyella acidiphila]MBE1160896.1 TetR family transcriptional regulator [Dyella acidiphila]